MKTLIRSIFLCLILIFCLAGIVTAEEGVNDQTIKLGSHMDFSGPAALWGKGVSKGMEMRVREINEGGGIYGRNLELIIEDDGYDPKKAILATNKIINLDRVFAFIGNMGSVTGLATKRIISRNKIPNISPISAATGYFEPFDRYCFLFAPPNYDQARVLIKYMVENLGHKDKRFGMIYQDDELGHDVKRGVEDQLKAYNLKLVESVSYKRGTVELSSQILRLKNAKVDVVFLGSTIIEIVNAIKGIRKTGWDPVIGTVNTAETKYVQLLAKKSGITADGLYFAATTKAIRADNPDQSIRDWWNKYVEMNNQEPDLAEAWGYSAIYTFEKAAIKAGENLTREKLIEAFETFRDEKNEILGGLPLTFTPTDHLGTRACYVAQMKNGAYELISEVMSY